MLALLAVLLFLAVLAHAGIILAVIVAVPVLVLLLVASTRLGRGCLLVVVVLLALLALPALALFAHAFH